MTTSEGLVLLPEVEDELNTIITNYYEYNQQYKTLGDTKGMYNNRIKEILEENNLTKYVSKDGYKVSVSTTNKPTYCEDQLLEFLRQFNIPNLIRTKEYIDMSVLEDAIYRGDIDASLLAPFKEDHYTTRLNCTLQKKLQENV